MEWVLYEMGSGRRLNKDERGKGGLRYELR